MRKWTKGGRCIRDVAGFQRCLETYGGVYNLDSRRFENRGWVLGWRLATILARIYRRSLWFPVLVRRGRG